MSRTTTTSGKRWYDWRGERYWSVTTILSGGLPKRALIYWAANEVAAFACDNVGEVAALIERDERDAAYDLLKRAPWRKRDKAADLGSAIHEAIEALILGKPYPTWPLPIRPRMKAFAKFVDEHAPEFLLSETPVFHRDERYAGTLDVIANIGERTWLIDTKTSEKGPYAEAGLQLAAYRFAQFTGLPDGSEQPLPAIDGAAVLKLTDAGYELFQIRADETMFKHFLYCRENFRFLENVAKTVVQPWTASEETPEALEFFEAVG